MQYNPYGEVITSTLPVTVADRIFTDQRFDSSTDRLSYCQNHPVSYVDPSVYIPFWDVLDVACFAWSSYKLYREPSWVNLGSGALDAISLLSLIPGIGLLRIRKRITSRIHGMIEQPKRRIKS